MLSRSVRKERVTDTFECLMASMVIQEQSFHCLDDGIKQPALDQLHT